MLQLEQLVVGYGPLTVLREVSLRVDGGEIVAVIGANGAGKTTLLKAISARLPVSSGSTRFEGVDITNEPAHRIVHLGIAQVPEGRQVFADMTVQDNLELGAFSWAHGGPERQAQMTRVFELFPILAERVDQLAGTLSGGQQQMLAIGRGLMARPKLLLLDEPSLGLAPMVVKTIFDVILQLKESGLAILLVEQNARAALAMADRAYVLETGRVIAEGRGQDLLRDEGVRRSYLGYGAGDEAEGPDSEAVVETAERT
jgi:branched-chain amino acid transport system ATP-binding protein